MNRVEKNSMMAVVIAIIVLIGFIGWLFVKLQTLNDTAICRKTPLDQMEQADYQYCVSQGLLR